MNKNLLEQLTIDEFMFNYIDLFCGAGGTTSGIEDATFEGKRVSRVLACINHDLNAINSHRSNHPKAIHLVEDIRTAAIEPLNELLNQFRGFRCLVASLECTSHSRAKGGKPKNADSRTLAFDLYRYISALNFDFIYIENVQEFLNFGPLDEEGHPIKERNGEYYRKWVSDICSYGYHYEYKILNSADFGAHTSRKRYFGIFAKVGLPIVFPKPTHSKKNYRPVKEVLDFKADRGESIFNRKKPLSENTLRRIYSGCIKYIAGGEEAFLVKYNSTNKKTGISHPPSINDPSPVVSTQGRLSLVQPEFLVKYHGNGKNYKSLDEPASTLSTKDRLGFVQAEFLHKYYRGENNHSSIEAPAGTLMTSDKHSLVTCYLMNPQWGNTNSWSVERPCFTLIARMDKAPPYLVQLEEGIGIEVYETDSPYTRKIKEFMALYGIADIRMRMLLILELLRIQGFKENYILCGTQTEKKKYIGNAVVPVIPKKMNEALAEEIIKGGYSWKN